MTQLAERLSKSGLPPDPSGTFGGGGNSRLSDGLIFGDPQGPVQSALVPWLAEGFLDESFCHAGTVDKRLDVRKPISSNAAVYAG